MWYVIRNTKDVDKVARKYPKVNIVKLHTIAHFSITNNGIDGKACIYINENTYNIEWANIQFYSTHSTYGIQGKLNTNIKY